MHKILRCSAAALLSAAIASAGMITAYADEVDYSHTGPGFEGSSAAGTTSQESNGNVIIRTDNSTETSAAAATGEQVSQTAPDGTTTGTDSGNGPVGATTAESQSQAGTSAQGPTEATTQTASGPVETADGTQTTTAGAAGVAGTYEPVTFNSDGEAAMAAYNHVVQFGTSIPFIDGSGLRTDGTWTPTFNGGDMIHNGGNGWYSMQMILRNYLGNLIYRTYSSTTGWSPWVMNGQETTHLTAGPVEAVQVRMAGDITNDFDLIYQATLSDGTTLDWATKGQTAGTMGEGKWLIGFRMQLVPKGQGASYPNAKTMSTAAGTDGVVFNGTTPTYKSGDGIPLTGWGWVNNQRYYFQNNQAVTGWQYIDGYKYYFDETGKLIDDVRDIIGNAGPYMIKINRQTDTLTVYAPDGSNGYILPVVSFVTTTGDDTPYGTFKMPEKYRWRLMIGNVYTQYAMRIKDGFMLHSVIFNSQNKYSLDAETYNNLGIGKSHGCTRIKTGEAEWIYNNCPVGTTIQIYDSDINGPFEKPVLDATIPDNQIYDPTDMTVPEAVADAAAKAANAAAEEQTANAIPIPMPSAPIN